MHEAGHAVIAVKSKHHLICKNIVTDNSGAGMTYVSPLPDAPNDLETAKEYAAILLAGFAVEKKLQADGENVVPNPECAKADYEMAKRRLQEWGGNSRLFQDCEAAACSLVAAHWTDIQKLGEKICHAGGHLDAADAYDSLGVLIPSVRLLNLPHVPRPKSQEVTEKLLTQAQDYAASSLHDSGKLLPCLFADSPTGPIRLDFSVLTDERAKHDFSNTARLVCLAYNVTAAVLIMESTMKSAKADEPLDPAGPHSEALCSQRLVLLSSETAGQPKLKVLSIIRDENGSFLRFDESEGPKSDDCQGQFEPLIPSKKPDGKAKMAAAMKLQEIGITQRSLRGN